MAMSTTVQFGHFSSAEALAFLKTCPQTGDTVGDRIAMYRRLSREDAESLRQWRVDRGMIPQPERKASLPW